MTVKLLQPPSRLSGLRCSRFASGCFARASGVNIIHLSWLVLALVAGDAGCDAACAATVAGASAGEVLFLVIMSSY